MGTSIKKYDNFSQMLAIKMFVSKIDRKIYVKEESQKERKEERKKKQL